MMPPRIKCAATTREAILSSAHRRFLEESYDNVGLRDIARDVGVDVSLIGRYFGSKEELFREVLRHRKAPPLEGRVPPEELPRYLAQIAVPDSSDGDSEHIERLQIILRSASSPVASALVHDAFHADVLAPMAEMLPGENACTRATLAMSILTGTVVLRAIMGVDSFAACDQEAVRSDLARLLEAALFGESRPSC